MTAPPPLHVAPIPPSSLGPQGLAGQGIARDPGGLHYSVIPLPAYPTDRRDMSCRASAVTATYTGRLEEAVDIYRGTVGENGIYDGILSTMAHGLLGCPQSFQGDPEMCSALLDANGTAGDDAVMHPESECAQIIKDMTGFGLGLGQYLLTCWRCRSTDWDKCSRIGPGGERVFEFCKRCDAWRLDRPVGVRELFSIQHRDIRWLWQNTYTRQWYFTARNGLFPVQPGAGEWGLFSLVPYVDPWRYGPWIWATIAAIFARDSSYDRQGISAVSAPIHIFQATSPTHPDTREKAESEIEKLAFQNRIILPGEWKHEIHEAANRYHDVATGIIEWATSMFEVGITGTRMSLGATAAFSDASTYMRVTSERRGFIGRAWSRQKREQGLVWWGLDNYGTRNVPVSIYDVRSPADKKAEVDAWISTGNGLAELSRGLSAHGRELEPSCVDEMMQRLGFRTRQKGDSDTSKLPLGVDAVGSLVKGDEGRAGLGLGPFGDDRGEKTNGELAERAPEIPKTRPRRKAKQ